MVALVRISSALSIKCLIDTMVHLIQSEQDNLKDACNWSNLKKKKHLNLFIIGIISKSLVSSIELICCLKGGKN